MPVCTYIQRYVQSYVSFYFISRICSLEKKGISKEYITHICSLPHRLGQPGQGLKRPGVAAAGSQQPGTTHILSSCTFTDVRGSMSHPFESLSHSRHNPAPQARQAENNAENSDFQNYAMQMMNQQNERLNIVMAQLAAKDAQINELHATITNLRIQDRPPAQTSKAPASSSKPVPIKRVAPKAQVAPAGRSVSESARVPVWNNL